MSDDDEAYTFSEDNLSGMNPRFYEDHDNQLIRCSIELKVPKIDRDYSIFGDYEVTLGARGYASADFDTEFVSLLEEETDFFLEESFYDSGNDYEESDEDSLYLFDIDSKTWSIDVEADFDIKGRGEQTMKTELMVSASAAEDDILRITLSLELPEEILEEGVIAYQYVWMLAEGDDYAIDGYTTVGCKQEINTSEYSEEITAEIQNYNGNLEHIVTSYSDIVGKDVNSQNSADRIEEGGPFELSHEEYYYGTWNMGNG